MIRKLPKSYLTNIVLFIALFMGGATGWALPPESELIKSHEKLQVFKNKSEMLVLKTPAKRVSVVAPEIADVQVVDPKHVMVTGKAIGETSLVVWTDSNKSRLFDVQVIWNVDLIRQTLQTLMPEEAIDVVSMENGIALKGYASGIEKVEQAMKVAQLFVPNVINMIVVPGVHQILLKVKIAEVARSFRHEFGADIHSVNGATYGGSTLGGLTDGQLDTSELEVSELTTLFFGLQNRNVSAFIQALRSKGMINLLAEPNLIARSGEKASFLAGGEFPIPIVQGGASSNSITIEYKEFGVRLNFTPVVLAEKSIRLEIAPEVSDLDFAQGIKLGGFEIPLILTRRAQTVVKLKHGQTFAIAGLISRSKQKNTRKIPFAGDLPVMGQFFRSEKLDGEETELLILVTPYLITPLTNDQAEQQVPQALQQMNRDEEGRDTDGKLTAKPVTPKSSGNLQTKRVVGRSVIAAKQGKK